MLSYTCIICIYCCREFTNDGSVNDMTKHRLNKILRRLPSKGDFEIDSVLKSVYFFSWIDINVSFSTWRVAELHTFCKWRFRNMNCYIHVKQLYVFLPTVDTITNQNQNGDYLKLRLIVSLSTHWVWVLYHHNFISWISGVSATQFAVIILPVWLGC